MSARLQASLVALCVGCGFDPSANLSQGGAGSDGGPGSQSDATVDAGDDYVCFQPQGFGNCSLGSPNGALIIDDDSTFDTDTGTLTIGVATSMPTTQLALEPEAMVLFVESLEIEATRTLRVVGTRPLVLVVDDGAEINGVLDVSAQLSVGAAGSNPGICSSSAPTAGEDDGGGAAGGGGGAFAAAGGDGGDGDDDGSDSDGGDGGDPVSLPSSVRGGCPGARGGTGASATFGVGGAGGGALHVAARNGISVSGTGVIDASGGGGEPGTGDDSGGGGGGSGGYIRLETSSLTIDAGAIIVANGGGGGGGSGFGSRPGSPGQNGQRSVSAATGGPGGQFASAGADGSSLASPAGADRGESAAGGAGGGGGSAGFIVLPSGASVDGGAIISPAAVPPG